VCWSLVRSGVMVFTIWAEAFSLALVPSRGAIVDLYPWSLDAVRFRGLCFDTAAQTALPDVVPETP